MFEIYDQQLFSRQHEREVIKTKIDSKASEMYLVTAIHEMYSIDESYSINHEVEEWAAEEILKENSEKSEKKILDRVYEEIKKIEEVGKFKTIMEEGQIISIERLYEKSGYSYTEINLDSKPTKQNIFSSSIGTIRMDDKTNKIVYLNVCLEEEVKQPGTEERLRQYVTYLGLDIIDDWNYDGENLISAKAQFIVRESCKDKIMLLYIIPWESEFASIMG